MGRPSEGRRRPPRDSRHTPKFITSFESWLGVRVRGSARLALSVRLTCPLGRRARAVTKRTGLDSGCSAGMLAAAALLALAASAVALPVTSGTGCASSGTDPAFTTSCDQLAAAVVCPNGLTGAVRPRTVALAELAGQRYRPAGAWHGQQRKCACASRPMTTDSTQESWGQGPYTQLLPKAANIGASCDGTSGADP